MNTEVMFSSKTDQWATPQDFFDKLNEEFHFTLDPCADEFNHKCDRFFSEKENGLVQDWSGETVFCNPPYGRETKNGFRNVSQRFTKAVVLWLLCSFLHELIHSGSTNTYTRKLKFVS